MALALVLLILWVDFCQCALSVAFAWDCQFFRMASGCIPSAESDQVRMCLRFFRQDSVDLVVLDAFSRDWINSETVSLTIPKYVAVAERLAPGLQYHPGQ